MSRNRSSNRLNLVHRKKKNGHYLSASNTHQRLNISGIRRPVTVLESDFLYVRYCTRSSQDKVKLFNQVCNKGRLFTLTWLGLQPLKSITASNMPFSLVISPNLSAHSLNRSRSHCTKFTQGFIRSEESQYHDPRCKMVMSCPLSLSLATVSLPSMPSPPRTSTFFLCCAMLGVTRLRHMVNRNREYMIAIMLLSSKTERRASPVF